MPEIIEVIKPAEELGVEPAKHKSRPKLPKWETDTRDRIKAAIKKYGKALGSLAELDSNEADTRLFVTDFLCDALGYDKYTELSTEYRVKNEYVDYGIRIEKEMVAFVEVKRINTKLGAKHLRQAQSYAVNEGVEWIVLTNGAQWQIYHLSDRTPIVTDLVLSIDLMSDDTTSHKAGDMFYLAREAMKRGKHEELWQAKRATSPKSLGAILRSQPVLATVRKELKKATGYSIDLDELSRLIDETCLAPDCVAK